MLCHVTAQHFPTTMYISKHALGKYTLTHGDGSVFHYLHDYLIVSISFVPQVIFGKSSCGDFAKEAYTAVVYHNR